jgi:hypothetical protein
MNDRLDQRYVRYTRREMDKLLKSDPLSAVSLCTNRLEPSHIDYLMEYHKDIIVLVLNEWEYSVIRAAILLERLTIGQLVDVLPGLRPKIQRRIKSAIFSQVTKRSQS